MKLKFLSVFALSIFFIASFSWGEPLSGKTAFLNNKCNLCHSVESEKIEKTSGGYQKSKEKNVPPDLSGIGTTAKADWIIKYLKKTEALDGVKHPRLYRGSEGELLALAKWLESLK